MRKHRRLYIIFALLLLVSTVLCMGVGTYRISASEILQVFAGRGSSVQNMTIFQLRLPRMAVAVSVGAALAVSGSVLQSLTRNDLAEPGVLGINAGASLAVITVINAGGTFYYNVLSSFRLLLMPFAAIAGAFAAAALIFSLSRKHGKISRIALVLTGIGVNAGLNAAITFYQLRMSKGDYNQALTWISGSLWGSSWQFFNLAAPGIALLILFICWKGPVMDIMDLGDELATGLGVDVEKERKWMFAAAVALAALATAVAGNMAFVGLLGAHIAKKLAGPSYRKHIPLAVMVGALIVMVADTICRNAFSPLEVPAGIMISLIGVPYFIYLMRREA